MTHLLFIDESGQDHRDSPYEVLAGICIEDRDIWNFIRALQDSEIHHFGQRISHGNLEFKGKKLLKKKTFRLAGQCPPFSPEERRDLAKSCLENGNTPTKRNLAALGQAKIAFAENVLELCSQYRLHAFASVVSKEAKRQGKDFLRKDYAYLFERYFYYLEDIGKNAVGLVVFDELERSAAHILADQMAQYFIKTKNGRIRSSQIIPEPFFVHSELTTAIQVADIIAYIISWNVRFSKTMDKEKRPELDELGQMALNLRYRNSRDYQIKTGLPMEEWTIWSFSYLDDLRPRVEKT